MADEPVSALDVSVRSQILNLMAELQAEHQLAYLMVSHDLTVIHYFADHIAVMYLGKIVESGAARRAVPLPGAPLHPRAHRRRARSRSPAGPRRGAAAIRGELPSATAPPSGCRFRTRCPAAQALCAEQEPPLRAFGPGHQAACHFPLTEPRCPRVRMKSDRPQLRHGRELRLLDRMGADEDLLGHVTSANIACGFHAGDPRMMDATVALAAERGVVIGAHVSYPDLVGFGRRSMKVSPAELITDVLYQIGALEAFCRRHGTEVRYVKAHGALYNDLADDEKLAAALAEAVTSYGDLAVLMLARQPGRGRPAGPGHQGRPGGLRRPRLHRGRPAGPAPPARRRADRPGGGRRARLAHRDRGRDRGRRRHRAGPRCRVAVRARRHARGPWHWPVRCASS